MPKGTIIVRVAEMAGKHGKTVSGLTYYTSGDGIGFSLKCQCGRDHTLTDAVVEHIRKELADEAKKDRPKMELLATTFERIAVGELLVATTNDNGHAYPLNTPVMKVSNKKEGGYCMTLPGTNISGTIYTYFHQGNKMQDNVHRIKGISKVFLDRIKDKALKKFFSDIPVKKL